MKKKEVKSDKPKMVKQKNDRLEVLRLIISSRQMGSQEELLNALRKEGFFVTQATLSRDLKQLKVAKASTMKGTYVYVLPNDTLYHRVGAQLTVREMMQRNGVLNVRFSGNMCVIKTRPGYASSIASNIDQADVPDVLGTVAGYDSILMVIAEGVTKEQVIEELNKAVRLD